MWFYRIDTLYVSCLSDHVKESGGHYREIRIRFFSALIPVHKASYARVCCAGAFFAVFLNNTGLNYNTVRGMTSLGEVHIFSCGKFEL